MNTIVFICWDGPQVYYLEGLFLPILRKLRDTYAIRIVQFTWGDPQKSEAVRQQCAADGIDYTRVEVWRKPSVTLGTVVTLWKGIRFIRGYVRRHRPEVVIYRGIFPSFMSSRALKNIGSVVKVMDADGLPLEERVDFAGMDPKGFVYRFLKRNEARAIRRSDTVLVRTAATTGILAPSEPVARKFRVVLNGRDAGQFKPLPAPDRQQVRRSLGLNDDALVLVYGGSLGPQYCVPEMLRLLDILVAQGVDAHFLVLTGDLEMSREWQLSPALSGRVTVRRVSFGQMPRHLAAADVGLAIREPAFSMIGVSPVKLGEYLLCGLSVIASRGIGDTERMLDGLESCYLLGDHSDASLRAAAAWAVRNHRRPGLPEAARAAGVAHYSLEEAVDSYRTALNREA